MRARVLSIVRTPAHDAALRALLDVGDWPRTEEMESRRASPNGLQRLRDRVPELAPDHSALARLLVETALIHRREDFRERLPEPSAAARVLFDVALSEAHDQPELAKSDRGEAAKLARRARLGEADAWDAAVMFRHDPNRCRIVRGVDGLRKETAPIPAPVDLLLRELLAGGITRPTPEPGPLPGATIKECGALLFAVWAATESAVRATSRSGESACSIVADVCGLSRFAMAKLWQKREFRTERALRR